MFVYLILDQSHDVTSSRYRYMQLFAHVYQNLMVFHRVAFTTTRKLNWSFVTKLCRVLKNRQAVFYIGLAMFIGLKIFPILNIGKMVQYYG